MLWLVNTVLLLCVYYTAAEYVGYYPVILVALARLGLSLMDVTFITLDEE